MTPTHAYLLVGASSLTHAWWNYRLKRAGGGDVFVALSKCCEVALLLPIFVWVAAPNWRAHAPAWPLVLGGAALVMANYLALSRAYRRGDLALVYPISRGGILVFLPAIGFVVFGETISPVGAVALLLIVAGSALLPLRRFTAPLAAPRNGPESAPQSAPLTTREVDAVASPPIRLSAVAYALLAALAAAAYTAWDKIAVNRMPALVYFYAYTVVTAALFLLLTLRQHARADVRATWHAHRGAIVQVGALNAISYLLFLVALRDGTSSYVIAVRQLSILWGVLLGHFLLKESISPPQRLGLTMLLAGCLTVALAT